MRVRAPGGSEAILELAGTSASPELIPRDPRLSARWLQHGYPDPIARWNVHPEYELHLIRRGHGRFIVGDAIGTFSAGQLVLVGPNVAHHWISDLEGDPVIPDRDVVLQFRDEWVRECRAVVPELEDVVPLLANARRGIEFLGRTGADGARRLQEIGGLSGSTRVGAIFSLFGVLASSPESDRRYLTTTWLPTITYDDRLALISDSIDYIEENLGGDIRLSEAARRVRRSDSSFSRSFRAASGQSFSDTVRRLRLARAIQLIETTSLPIAAVADRAGYRNLSNFNRQFLREYGLTPRQHRQRVATRA